MMMTTRTHAMMMQMRNRARRWYCDARASFAPGLGARRRLPVALDVVDVRALLVDEQREVLEDVGDLGDDRLAG